MIRYWLSGFALVVACAEPRVISSPPVSSERCRAPVTDRDGQHDFDFELGAWTAHLKRREHPLTGSTTWVDATGTSIVRPLWGGAANVGELDVTGPRGHVVGMSLRLYDPKAHTWNISFANRDDGALTPPLVGQFHDGRGELYDRETFQGRPICVRFMFSDITEQAFHFEQAFSPDDGATWEVNWISSFDRVSEPRAP